MNRVMEIDGTGRDGGMAFWDSSSVKVDTLRQALSDNGMGGLFPKDTRIPWALKETLSKFVSHRNLKLKHYGNPIKLNPLKSDTVQGVEAVRMVRGKTKNAHDFLMSIVHQNGQIKVADFNPLHLPLQPSMIAGLEVALTAQFDQHMMIMPTHMVSGCLNRVLGFLGGVLAKGDGGLWFIPGDAVDTFEKVGTAMMADGGGLRITTLKFMLKPGESSYRMVLDAIKKEAADTVKEMSDGLAELAGSKLMERGINTRLRTLEELRAKVKMYEELLGVTLSDVHAALKTTEDAVHAHNVMNSMA